MTQTKTALLSKVKRSTKGYQQVSPSVGDDSPTLLKIHVGVVTKVLSGLSTYQAQPSSYVQACNRAVLVRVPRLY